MIFINNDIDINLWNKFVDNNIFHRFEWFYVIQNTYKLKPLFILSYEKDKFALIGSFKTCSGYISLPFVSYSGFLYNDKKILTQLKKFLNTNQIIIDSRDLLNVEITSGYVNPIVTVNSFEKFWEKISSNTRNQFRKSEKNNFKFINEKKIDNFYKLYSLGMKNLGTPCHGILYFRELMKYFSYCIFTIFNNNTPIGSMFCLYSQDTLSVLYAYTLPDYSKQYANYFLYLNAVKWLVNNNLKYLDLGRSTYGKGTFHFKKKFRPKFYGINSNINYSSNKKLKLISNIWKKLPLGMANFLGPKIRKYLP